jgi:L-ascorbate metabolism protein UlaG (beta-lactamase superfamily)
LNGYGKNDKLGEGWVNGDIMEVKWLGHASWKIKTGGQVIYVDPYVGEYDEPADLILSTHSHADHCDPEKVNLVKGEGTVIIAPEDCGEKLGAEVTSLEPGEKYVLDGVTVGAVQAYNFKRFRSPGKPFHPKGLGVGYLIISEGKTVYHVGDTDFIDEMKTLKNIDLMLVASGGTYTMDNADAIEAVVEVNPGFAVPMHIWDTDPSEFKRGVEERSGTEVLLIEPGDAFTL